MVHLCPGSLRALTVNNESVTRQPRGKHSDLWLASLRQVPPPNTLSSEELETVGIQSAAKGI